MSSNRVIFADRARGRKTQRAAPSTSSECAGAAPLPKRSCTDNAAASAGQMRLTSSGELGPPLIPVPSIVGPARQKKVAAGSRGGGGDALHGAMPGVEDCATHHGVFVDTLAEETRVANQLPELGDRLETLDKLKHELANAHAPLVAVSVVQRELSGTLQFTSDAASRLAACKELPEISIAYATSYMRAPNTHTGERACRMGTECDALRVCRELHVGVPFGFREFLFPAQQTHFEETLDLPLVPQICYFCHLKNTSIHFGLLLWQDQDADVVVQPFRSLCDVDGEVGRNACMQPGTDRFYGIVAPIVRHELNMYTVEKTETGGLGCMHYTDAVYFRPTPAPHA